MSGTVAGCYSTLPAHATWRTGCNQCTTSTCADCNSGYIYVGSSCCKDNTQTCSSDSECCSSHCSMYGQYGTPLAPSQYHCCALGQYWDVLTNTCKPYGACYPSPCTIASGSPFNVGSTNPWWDTASCISQDTACCYSSGAGDYIPIANLDLP